MCTHVHWHLIKIVQICVLVLIHLIKSSEKQCIMTWVAWRMPHLGRPRAAEITTPPALVAVLSLYHNCNLIMIWLWYHDAFDYDRSDQNYYMHLIRLLYNYHKKLTRSFFFLAPNRDKWKQVRVMCRSHIVVNSQHSGWKVYHSTDWPKVESVLCICVTRYPIVEARGGDGHPLNAPTYPCDHTHTLGCSNWEGNGIKRQARSASAGSEQIDHVHVSVKLH